jgi:hypothetical protein
MGLAAEGAMMDATVVGTIAFCCPLCNEIRVVKVDLEEIEWPELAFMLRTHWNAFEVHVCEPQDRAPLDEPPGDPDAS